MLFLRGLLAATLIAAAAGAIVREPILRCRCNRVKSDVEQWIQRSDTTPSDFERKAAALRNIPRLERCATDFRDDWEALFLLGGLLDVAGRDRAAMAHYQTALDLERRPEIYYAISLIHFEQGRVAEGLANAQSAAFFNLYYADQFDPQLRMQLWNAIQLERQRLKMNR